MAFRPALATIALCCVALGCSAPALEAAKVPEWRPVAPPSLGLRFELKADWGIQNKASLALDKGWAWEGFSPAQAAWIRVSSHPQTLDFAHFEAVYVKSVRASTEAAVLADPQGLFRSGPATVGGEPAVKITIRGRAVTLSGATEATTIVYALVRAGREYVFEFDAVESDLARFRPAFAHAVATVRFLNAA